MVKKQIIVGQEVLLMAALEATISDYGRDNGYKEGQHLSEEHSGEVMRAVEWLSSKYGPPA